MKDVAERAGVSLSAVSRSFTPGASVSQATRRKVEDAAQALGYSPNALASSLTTGRTGMIGLVADNFRNPLFLEVFDRFTRGLQARDLRPLLVNLSDETDAQSSVRLLRQYSVDAVVVASSTLPSGFAIGFQQAGIPVVHAFGRPFATPEIPVVGTDNIECGRMAARCLIGRGYRRLGFLGGPTEATSSQDRLAGFVEEAHTHQGVTVAHVNANAYSFRAGRMAMKDWLRAPAQEAYFCGDDVLSLGAMSALSDAGLDVPEDVGVIGLNDMEMAGWETVRLTTIRQPVTEIVDASIELIAALLENPSLNPETRVFDCQVIERGTLQPAPATTPGATRPR